jgi:hypothetical protein
MGVCVGGKEKRARKGNGEEGGSGCCWLGQLKERKKKEEEKKRRGGGERVQRNREKRREKREKKGKERMRKRKREREVGHVSCVWFQKKIMLSSSNKSCADTWQWKITFYFKAQTFINYIRTHYIKILSFDN